MRKIKKITAVLLSGIIVAAMLCGCGDTGAADNAPENAEKLVVGMELAYPPFETKDEEGNAAGISVDFSKAFGEYLGREVVIENISWDGLIPALQTGKVDMVISSMTITEEREEVIDFSIPYANAMLALLTNKNSGIASIEDMNEPGRKIAVKTGSTGYFYAEQNLPEAEIIALPDESACVTEVSQGKADGFIYDQLTIYRNWQSNLETTGAVFIPFQEVDKWGVAVQEGNTELREQLNAFIEEYTADGGFEELTEIYLKEEKEAFDELGFKWFFDLSE